MLHPNCKHEWNCECEWLQGRERTGDDEVEVFYQDKWVPRSILSVVKAKFVKSPIGIIPPHGYSGRDNHSIESLEWLVTLEKCLNERGKKIQIQHARNGGEKVVNFVGRNGLIKYKLDGYFELDEVKYVLKQKKNLKNNKSLEQRFRETKLKEKRLKQLQFFIGIFSNFQMVM